MIATKMIKTVCSALVCAVLILSGILVATVYMGGFSDGNSGDEGHEGHFLPYNMKNPGKMDLSGVDSDAPIKLGDGETQIWGEGNTITGPATLNADGTVTIDSGTTAMVNGKAITGSATVDKDGNIQLNADGAASIGTLDGTNTVDGEAKINADGSMELGDGTTAEINGNKINGPASVGADGSVTLPEGSSADMGEKTVNGEAHIDANGNVTLGESGSMTSGDDKVTGPAEISKDGTIKLETGATAEIDGNTITGPATITPNGDIHLDEGGSAVIDGETINGPADIMNALPSGENDYDFGTPNPDTPVVMTVTSEKDGILYLKRQSYGNYTGQGWTVAESYPILYQMASADYLRYYTAAFTDVAAAYDVVIKPAKNDGSIPYVMPYYAVNTSGISAQLSDTYISGSTADTYVLKCFEPSSEINDSISAEVINYEAGYRQYVYETYCEIDDEFKNELLALAPDSVNDAVGTQEIADAVEAYVRGSNYYNMNYDSNLDEQPNVVLAFLGEEYTDGVCQHYAAAATMLLRAKGIPARFTSGWMTPVVAGKETELSLGHAWVEYYIDGLGWQILDATASKVGGTISFEPDDIRVKDLKIRDMKDIPDDYMDNERDDKGGIKAGDGYYVDWNADGRIKSTLFASQKAEWEEKFGGKLSFEFEMTDQTKTESYGTKEEGSEIESVTIWLQPKDSDDPADRKNVTGRFDLDYTKKGLLQTYRFKFEFSSKMDGSNDGNNRVYDGTPVTYKVSLVAVDGTTVDAEEDVSNIISYVDYSIELEHNTDGMDGNYGEMYFYPTVKSIVDHSEGGQEHNNDEFWVEVTDRYTSRHVNKKPITVDFSGKVLPNDVVNNGDIKDITLYADDIIGGHKMYVTFESDYTINKAKIKTELDQKGNESYAYKIKNEKDEDITNNYSVDFIGADDISINGSVG